MLSGSLRGHHFPSLLPSGEAARSEDSRAMEMTATNSCSPLSAAEEYVRADWGDSELKKKKKEGREGEEGAKPGTGSPEHDSAAQ